MRFLKDLLASTLALFELVLPQTLHSRFGAEPHDIAIKISLCNSLQDTQAELKHLRVPRCQAQQIKYYPRLLTNPTR